MNVDINNGIKWATRWERAMLESQNLIKGILGNTIVYKGSYFSEGGCVFIDTHIVLDIIKDEFIRIDEKKTGDREVTRLPLADPDLVKKVQSKVRELRMNSVGQLLKSIVGPKYEKYAIWDEDDSVMSIDVKGDEYNDDTNVCYLYINEGMISVQSVLQDKIRNKIQWTDQRNMKFNRKSGVYYPLGNPHSVSSARRRIAHWLKFWEEYGDLLC